MSEADTPRRDGLGQKRTEGRKQGESKARSEGNRRKGEKKNKDVSDARSVARVDQTHDRRQLAPDWARWSVCLTFIRIRIGIL